MTDLEIQSLANQLEVIKKYFINHTFIGKSYPDFGLDIEFKIDGANRDLYIKQVKLYNDQNIAPIYIYQLTSYPSYLIAWNLRLLRLNKLFQQVNSFQICQELVRKEYRWVHKTVRHSV